MVHLPGDGYSAQPTTTPVDPIALALRARARDYRLVICAGAGLSVAADASLPTGRELAERLDTRLTQRMEGYTSPNDTADLVAVADAAAGIPGGLVALQHEVLDLANFEGAPPNYGHELLALLIAEGAVAILLTWNWDDCVERSIPEGERLQVARTQEDVEALRVPSVAKIHGCATRPPTLLITSEQLDAPPLWTEHAFATQITASTVIFLGIGDVADYAKRRLGELSADFPDLDLYVVSPSIRARWAESTWAELVPALPDERRVAKSANEFLDELGRAWAMQVLDDVGALLAGMNDPARNGTNAVLLAFGGLSAREFLRWCRASATGHKMGESVVRHPSLREAIVALGVLAGDTERPLEFRRETRCRMRESSYEVIVSCEMANATAIKGEAHRRAATLAALGTVRDEATFLVAGDVIGPLQASDLEERDILDGDVDSTDVIDGPRGVKIRLIHATELLQRAA